MAQTLRNATTRRLRVADLILLVAAVALGFAGGRFIAEFGEINLARDWDDLRSDWKDDRGRWFQSSTLILHAIDLATPTLVACSAAILISRLRNPRPRRRRLFRQPGFLGLVAALAVYSWYMAEVLGGFLYEELLPTAYSENFVIDLQELSASFVDAVFAWSQAASHMGMAVALAWVVAGAGGRLRPEPSWVDRAGRAMGVAWIALSFIERIAQFVFMLEI
jgi:hypothetical protein